MEYSLRLFSSYEFNTEFRRVLILILMEYSLRPPNFVAEFMGIVSLNPYSNGI